FTSDDLAALLSGGSNKDYESEETTGRFGTGFLVTHFLSPIIRLEGVIESDSQREQFGMALNRSGNEDEILNDMEAAEAFIKSARPLGKWDGIWTADFR